MNQLFVGITLDIIDYYPLDYDFNNYSFIFISEDQNFEREISYINSNQICQKVPIKGRDIKYSIKVTKDDSLIGISEFAIPFQILNKKDKIYDKVCPITMSDSIKKVLFGSTSNAIPLKIGIHATLQYLLGASENKVADKNEKTEKSEKKDKVIFKQKNYTKKEKEKKINPFTPKKYSQRDKPVNSISTSNSGFGTRLSYNNYNHKHNNSNNNTALNSSLNRLHKKVESSFISSMKYKNINIKDHPWTSSSQRQNLSSAKMRSVRNTHREMEKNKEKKEEREIKTENNEKKLKGKKSSASHKNIKKKNNSNINSNIIQSMNDVTDDAVNLVNENKLDDNITEIDLKNNFNKYIENNMNKKIDEIKDLNEMRNYTFDNLKNLLNYQMKYYELIKKEIDLYNKYNEQFLEYSEKYRTNLKILNKLNEENNLSKIKQCILLNNEKINNNKEKDIIVVKDKELTLLKDICSTMNGEEYNDLSNIENNGIKNKNEQFLILFKVLRKIGDKYGPLENLLTQSNSTEPQRGNLKKILKKYNKELESKNNSNNNMNNYSNTNMKINSPISAKNNNNNISIDKFEYVSLTKPDDIDKKIEIFLKQFYLSHKNIPKVVFRKTSKNNYEYGSQKVMVKVEGEAIRVRYMGGYLLLDKFVESYAPLEDNKKKNTKSSSINQNNRSNISKKTKNK